MKNVTPDEPPRTIGRPRRQRGRPPLLNTYARTVLLDALRRGDRLSVASRIAGVGSSTTEEWMRRGRGMDKRPATPFYVQFVTDVEMAEAEAEHNAVTTVHEAITKGDARTAIWFLERKEGWRQEAPAQSRSIVPSDPDVMYAPPGTNVIILSPDAVERLAREHLSAARGESPRDDDWNAARARLVEDTPPQP